MIVQRVMFKVKLGCRAEFIELTKAVVVEAGLTPRVCSYRHGPRDTVTSDLEFETEEDRQEFPFDYSRPKAAEWVKKLTDLIVPGTTNEVLQVY